ncbi:MAG: aminotransferase class I/II-fold pyridoxal phosphate-dependent enzyme [Clostridiales Family XIII bacterium]|jgi:methionine-gamma-lyase|nr:aminotransferase class I/II-fold pyridoxal phosphate-dependent enzyme [Clostridiales Family XIII bacterium]
MSIKNPATNLIQIGDGQFQKKILSEYAVPETLPIYLTSAYALDDIEALDALEADEHSEYGYSYSRAATPNADATSELLAVIDGMESGLLFSSGMAAIATSLLAFLSAGDHIIASSVIYGATYTLLSSTFARFGIETDFVDLSDGDISAFIKPNTKLVYVETISNPLMGVPDIDELSKQAHAHDVLVFIDNTFASPIVAKPGAHGADVVLYSATKYLGGHADIIAGAVTSSAANVAKIKGSQILFGTLLSVSASWLLARSLRTLDLRMRTHSKNAQAVAQFLESHPTFERVHYPGLASSESYERATRQFENGLYGGMLSADLAGGEDAALALIRNLQSIHFVPSLAGPATTVSYPVKTSHRFYEKETLDALGITAGQIRLSIGLEHVDDIIEELSRALKSF